MTTYHTYVESEGVIIRDTVDGETLRDAFDRFMKVAHDTPPDRESYHLTQEESYIMANAGPRRWRLVVAEDEKTGAFAMIKMMIADQ